MGQEIVAMKLFPFLSGRGHASKLAVGTGDLSPPFSCTRAPLAVFSLVDNPDSFLGHRSRRAVLAELPYRTPSSLCLTKKKEAARTASSRSWAASWASPFAARPISSQLQCQIQPANLFL